MYCSSTSNPTGHCLVHVITARTGFHFNQSEATTNLYSMTLSFQSKNHLLHKLDYVFVDSMTLCFQSKNHLLHKLDYVFVDSMTLSFQSKNNLLHR